MSAFDPDTDANAAIEIAGETLFAQPSGAAWWPAMRTLIVADLHFEKGSSFARRGLLLPPHDTFATLARLEADVERLRPAQVISLGDSFHDRDGPERLPAAAEARLAGLQAGRRWIWIAGNHDPGLGPDLDGDHAEELAIGALAFRHEPRRDGGVGEIAGHLHPAARVAVATGTVRRHCFAGDGARLILPAYGALAGGLDIASRAFTGLFRRDRLTVHLLGEGRVHRFPATAVVGYGLSRDGTGRRRASR